MTFKELLARAVSTTLGHGIVPTCLAINPQDVTDEIRIACIDMGIKLAPLRAVESPYWYLCSSEQADLMWKLEDEMNQELLG
jgi:hypothetical protein